MIFDAVSFYPENIDTIVCFMQPEMYPSFTHQNIQTAFDDYFGDDALNLSSGNSRTLRIKIDDTFVNLILVALDFISIEDSFDSLRKSILKLGTTFNELNSRNIFIDNLGNLSSYSLEEIARQFASTLPLCDYAFDKYKEKKADFILKNIFIYTSEEHKPVLDSALTEGANISKGICIARDLTNEPSDVLTPSELANRAKTFGHNYGFNVTVYDENTCQELGMTAFLAVARGSAYEPKLIVMHYRGDASSDSSLGIIGKGLCYDSGGLYLKPGASMEHSKADMAGGAAVIGAMCSIAMNKLPKNVTAVIAACENMLDGNGYRNGDIVHTMAGKSVFVGSTDAEGRLTLADAITYMVRHENVDSIIELSTLTGSCANFFSDVCCGVLTTDNAMYDKLVSISDLCGEKYWRLPYFDEYREFIKSDVADLHNTSTNGAGGICAGLFLDAFKEDKPFIHLDVAGMTFTNKKKDGYPKGGTGYGVKTIYNYIKY